MRRPLRQPLFVIGSALILLGLPGSSSAAQATGDDPETPDTLEASDLSPEPDPSAESDQFDFWLGIWSVNLRMQQEDGSWPESSVQAEASIYPVLGGRAVLELWDSQPIVGFSLRWFDPEWERWVLWLNWPGEDRSGSSGLEGAFHHGRGEFFSRRPTADGGERIARYTFSDITPDSLRWDDAFSTDGGKTWSSNWIMEFRRTGPPPELPAGGAPLPTSSGDEGRCTDPRFRVFESVAGSRSGTAVRSPGDGEPVEWPARLDGWRILDGCSVLARLAVEGADGTTHSLHLLTWNTYAQVFEESALDDTAGSDLEVFYGEPTEGSGPIVLELSGRGGGEPATSRHRWTLGDDGIHLGIETTGDGGRTWSPELEASFPAGE